MPRLSPPRKRGAVSYADVTSANVVGYQLIPVPVGFNIFTPTFEKIGDVMDIKDIEVVNADGSPLEDTYNDIVFQKIEESGDYSIDVYGFCPDAGGWNLDYEEVEKGTVTFKNGEGICINNTWNETVYFRVSGQVDLVNKNTIEIGFNLWGNSTPVTIDIKDVQVLNADGTPLEDTYNDIVFQKIESSGDYSIDVYGFCPDAGGWNLDYEELEKGAVTFAPGEAACVNNTWSESVIFKLPSPIK